MNVQVTADVVMVFGVISLLVERMWKIAAETKNGRNGNGKNGGGKYVTYQDLMERSVTCASGIHAKIDEYHNEIRDRFEVLGERIANLEAKV